MINTHIAKCKEIPFLRYALPIIIPESNLPTIAQELSRTLKLSLQLRCQFMTQDRSHAGTQADLPGSYTTRTNKLEMVQLMLNSYLAPRKIVFYKDFVVTVSEGEEATSTIDVKKEFERQLRDFARIKKYKVGRDGATTCEFFYNGKTGNSNDDLTISLLIALLMHKRFWSEEKYRNVRSSKL